MCVENAKDTGRSYDGTRKTNREWPNQQKHRNIEGGHRLGQPFLIQTSDNLAWSTLFLQ